VDGSRLLGLSLRVDGALTAISGSPYASSAQISDLQLTPNKKRLFMAGGGTVLRYDLDSFPTSMFPISTGVGGTSPASFSFDFGGAYGYIGGSSGAVSGYQMTGGSDFGENLPGSPFATGRSGDNRLMVWASGSGTGTFGYLAAAGASSGTITRYSLTAGVPTPIEQISTGQAPVLALDQGWNSVWLASGVNGTITTYRISSSTGALQATGQPLSSAHGSPFLMRVVPQTAILVVASKFADGSGSLTSYLLDLVTNLPSEADSLSGFIPTALAVADQYVFLSTPSAVIVYELDLPTGKLSRKGSYACSATCAQLAAASGFSQIP
jgi:hypothetical protein